MPVFGRTDVPCCKPHRSTTCIASVCQTGFLCLVLPSRVEGQENVVVSFTYCHGRALYTSHTRETGQKSVVLACAGVLPRRFAISWTCRQHRQIETCLLSRASHSTYNIKMAAYSPAAHCWRVLHASSTRHPSTMSTSVLNQGFQYVGISPQI